MPRSPRSSERGQGMKAPIRPPPGFDTPPGFDGVGGSTSPSAGCPRRTTSRWVGEPFEARTGRMPCVPSSPLPIWSPVMRPIGLSMALRSSSRVISARRRPSCGGQVRGRGVGQQVPRAPRAGPRRHLGGQQPLPGLPAEWPGRCKGHRNHHEADGRIGRERPSDSE